MRRVLYVGSVMLTVAMCVVAFESRTSAKPRGLVADVDTVYQLRSGLRVSSHGRFYRSVTGQIREESGNAVTITDTTTHTVTLLVIDRKEAHVFNVPDIKRAHIDPTKPAPAPYDTTVLDGHPVTKVRRDGENGRKQEVWTAMDLGIPIYSRLQAPGLTTEKMFRNVRAQDPDSALFQVPTDFTVFRHEPNADHPRNAPQ